MSESVGYYGWIDFKTKWSAQQFARAKAIREFFEDVEADGRRVFVSQPNGWRGGGLTVEEVLREAIGDVLKRFYRSIRDFSFHVEWHEHGPYPSSEVALEDIVEAKEVRV